MRASPQFPATERAASRPALPPPPLPTPGLNFADLLQQRGQATHGVLARPVAPPPPLRADPQPRNGVDRDNDDKAPTETQRAARMAAAKAGAKPGQQREKVVPATPPKPPSPSATPAEGASSEDRAVQRAAEDAAHGAAHGTDLRDWLASLKFQQPATADLALQETTGGTQSLSRLGSGGGTASAADAAGEPDASEDSPAAGSARLAMNGGTRSTGPTPELHVGTAAERHAELPEPPTTARDATPTLLSGSAGAVPRGFDPGTLAPIALPTPLYSPDFAQALGAQVSLLARDGVQQAELHLNPAEMGPISVQIEIDGQQARIDFSADTAVTREVIERGLPELAAALREQGLTLSGGGVSQRAPERREPGDERQAAGRSKRLTSATAGAVTARTAALPAAMGLLDLYV